MRCRLRVLPGGLAAKWMRLIGGGVMAAGGDCGMVCAWLAPEPRGKICFSVILPRTAFLFSISIFTDSLLVSLIYFRSLFCPPIFLSRSFSTRRHTRPVGANLAIAAGIVRRFHLDVAKLDRVQIVTREYGASHRHRERR